MNRFFEYTEEELKFIKEMKCGAILTYEIKASRAEIEKLKQQKNEMEYNELLKLLAGEQLAEAVNSKSVYESTENAIELIKANYNLEVTNQEVIEKFNEIQNAIEEKEIHIDCLIDELHDLTDYVQKQNKVS